MEDQGSCAFYLFQQKVVNFGRGSRVREQLNYTEDTNWLFQAMVSDFCEGSMLPKDETLGEAQPT